MEYLKINSLWKRHGWYFDENTKRNAEYQSGRQSFIIGDYAEKAFGNIKKWLVDEKIDGTNVRVMWQKPHIVATHDVFFGGRTDNAQMPCNLLTKLKELFPSEKFVEIFPNAERVILFGEGYGPKIQACGANYRKDPGFILFDVFIDGWWLERSSVLSISGKLGIDVVPSLGVMTEEEIIELVKSNPMSRCSHSPQVMEGVVCRSEPIVLFRNHNPIMWKLKCKEFV